MCQGYNLQYPLHKGVHWSQKHSGLLQEEQNFLLLLRIKPSVLGCLACSLIAILTELLWFPSMHKLKTLLSYVTVQVSSPKIPNGF